MDEHTEAVAQALHGTLRQQAVQVVSQGGPASCVTRPASHRARHALLRWCVFDRSVRAHPYGHSRCQHDV